ncbi:DUF3737 family protein [Candidatus Stoquefichus sp. SB1]|jgi:hypothetical protein|uniref:DUF3737 family protein n=1 Tax=Candidatus Stoquefichus sp. SB1 TaxID=1658109 RepID=UPI00067EC2C4|nr:DUF3737 family protein [Candidatus Stoquefichus sp. SB1]
MKNIKQQFLTGERALFQSADLKIEDCVFADGESPLKESHHIDIEQSIFRWKYPLWYCQNIKVMNSTLLETARSGIWYTNHIEISDSIIEAPKTFRRASDIHLNNVDMPIALESFWNCQNITLKNVTARGDYFAMNSENIVISGLNLTGNYCFDGCKNIEIHDSKLISKDAFWNCENVIVYDSIIIGEYLAWNTKNITFINCTIESLQGLCYIENLKMVNCKLINTTLAFEYCSHVDAHIVSHVDSIMNPVSGTIQVQSIGELILDEKKIDPSKVDVIVEQPTITKEVLTECVCS